LTAPHTASGACGKTSGGGNIVIGRWKQTAAINTLASLELFSVA